MDEINQIFKHILEHKKSIKRYGIKRIGIFGSIARGDTKPSSDIDLLVEFDPQQKTYKNFIASSELLERVLNRQIDLVTPQALSPYIKPYIDKEIKYVQIS